MNVQTFVWTSKVLQLLVAKLISTHNNVAWSQVCQHGLTKQYPLISQPNGSKNWRAKLLANTYIFPPNGFQEGKHEHHWLAFIWKRPNISVQLPSTEWRSGLECWLGKMMMMPPSAIAGDWVNHPCIHIYADLSVSVCAQLLFWCLFVSLDFWLCVAPAVEGFEPSRHELGEGWLNFVPMRPWHGTSTINFQEVRDCLFSNKLTSWRISLMNSNFEFKFASFVHFTTGM